MGVFMAKQLKLREVRDFCLATKDEKKPVNLDEDNAASQYKDYDGWTIHRKRAWVTLFSGCHYDYIDFSIINYCEAGTAQSQKHIRSWMKFLSEFIHSIDLVNAKPAADWLIEKPMHTLDAVLAVDAQDYCIYLADERELEDPEAGAPLSGTLRFNLNQGRYSIACFSPVTGTYSPAIQVEGGREVCLSLPEFTHDLVVRIRKK